MGNYYALAVAERLGLEESGGMVWVGPVHYNTVKENERLGSAVSGKGGNTIKQIGRLGVKREAMWREVVKERARDYLGPVGTRPSVLGGRRMAR